MAESNSLALATELRDACTGHPVASIRWPHRLLHRAADEIERLQALENGPAGLADANSKSPATSSQSERIAVLEAAREALKPFADQSKHFDEGAVRMGFAPSFDEYRPAVSFTHGELRAARRAYDALPAALTPLGEE